MSTYLYLMSFLPGLDAPDGIRPINPADQSSRPAGPSATPTPFPKATVLKAPFPKASFPKAISNRPAPLLRFHAWNGTLVIGEI